MPRSLFPSGQKKKRQFALPVTLGFTRTQLTQHTEIRPFVLSHEYVLWQKYQHSFQWVHSHQNKQASYSPVHKYFLNESFCFFLAALFTWQETLSQRKTKWMKTDPCFDFGHRHKVVVPFLTFPKCSCLRFQCFSLLLWSGQSKHSRLWSCFAQHVTNWSHFSESTWQRRKRDVTLNNFSILFWSELQNSLVREKALARNQAKDEEAEI